MCLSFPVLTAARCCPGRAWGAGSHPFGAAFQRACCFDCDAAQWVGGMRARQADERSATWRDTDPYARVSQEYPRFFKRTIRSPINPMAAPPRRSKLLSLQFRGNQVLSIAKAAIAASQPMKPIFDQAVSPNPPSLYRTIVPSAQQGRAQRRQRMTRPSFSFTHCLCTPCCVVRNSLINWRLQGDQSLFPPSWPEPWPRWPNRGLDRCFNGLLPARENQNIWVAPQGTCQCLRPRHLTARIAARLLRKAY